MMPPGEIRAQSTPLGDTNERGDGPGEMGDSLLQVDLGPGRTATSISVGIQHSCAVLDGGDVKCWGYNAVGQLGIGDAQNRGDAPGEMGAALPVVDLGTGLKALSVSTGNSHTCAILNNSELKCWGWNYGAALGLGDQLDRGDNPGEMGDSLPAVDL